MKDRQFTLSLDTARWNMAGVPKGTGPLVDKNIMSAHWSDCNCGQVNPGVVHTVPYEMVRFIISFSQLINFCVHDIRHLPFVLCPNEANKEAIK